MSLPACPAALTRPCSREVSCIRGSRELTAPVLLSEARCIRSRTAERQCRPCHPGAMREGPFRGQAIVTDLGIDIRIDRADVCRSLGYRSMDSPSANIALLIDDCIAKSLPLLQPAFACVIREVRSIHGRISVLDDGSRFESEIIGRLLEHCQRVAVYVVTIGGQIEDMSSALAEDGYITESYVVDSIGSSATERLAEVVHGKIAQDASAVGLCASRRFSPGYCDWHIDQQSVIFGIARGDSAGVHLTSAFLMLPRKSSSGIVGLGRDDGFVETYNPCLACRKAACPGRR
jgi:hypothetical protein